MMKKSFVFVSLLIVLTLLAACTQAVEETAVITVGGQEYSQSDLEALGTISVDYTDKDGEVTTYEGVSLAGLLQDAGVDDDGDNVTLTAADCYIADIALVDVMACDNCIVAFDDGGLRTVMPEQSGKLQVKDLVDISIN
jgi:hypothetical protein